MPAADPIVYLNGRFLPRSRAHLSVEDRGVLFADGVYEVTRYYAGQPFELDRHVRRLHRSLAGIRLDPPDDAARLPAITDELLARNGVRDAKVYWQVTRGPAPRDHRPPKQPTPTVFAIAYPAPPVDFAAPPAMLTAALLPDERWSNCWIKSLMLLGNTLAASAAADTGADTAILHRDDRVTEGASTNVFVVRGGELFTHPADRWILHGVTRAVILELARELGVATHEEPVTPDELLDADEVFVTGTATQLATVVRVSDRTIGSGGVGPVTARLHAAFLDRVRRCIETAPEAGAAGSVTRSASASVV